MSNKEQEVRVALSRVLTNIENYPKDVQARLWGASLSKVIDAATDAIMRSGTVEIEDRLYFKPDVTRVEVIDSTGRAYTNYAAENVMTSLQDDGMTLKVFIKGQP